MHIHDNKQASFSLPFQNYTWLYDVFSHKMTMKQTDVCLAICKQNTEK